MKPRPNYALLVLVFDRFRREMLWIGGVGRNGATAAKSPATGAELGPGALSLRKQRVFASNLTMDERCALWTLEISYLAWAPKIHR